MSMDMMDSILSMGIVGIVILVVLAIIGLIIYFIPTTVARKNKSPNKVAVILLNIFLGWSLIGWIIALVLACKKPAPPTTINTTGNPIQ